MSHVSSGPEPTEFQYTGRSRREGAVWVLFVSVLFLFSSVLTGAWGIASLLHASWLESGDLPGGSATAWGIVLLCVATIEGLCGLLILFSRRIGFVTAIAIAALGILGHAAVFSAYPIWSIAGIAAYLLIIGILLANWPRH